MANAGGNPGGRFRVSGRDESGPENGCKTVTETPCSTEAKPDFSGTAAPEQERCPGVARCGSGSKTTPHRGQHGAAREAGPTSGSANTDDTAPCQANGPGGCGDRPKGRDCFALRHSTSSGCAAEPCCCADCWGLDCGIYSAFDLFDCAGGRLRLRNFLRGRNTR